MVSTALAIFGSLISINFAPAWRASQAQELTVEQAVSRAIETNPRLKAAMLEVKAAEFSVSSARALTNPTVTYTPGFTRAGSDEELLIAQPLEISGTRSARAGVASAELKGARAQATLELRALVFETKAAYFDLARLQERMLLVQELLKSSKELESIAGRQVQLGSRAGIELSQIRIESTRAKQQATLAEAEYKAKLAELNALMGRDSDEPVKLSSIDTQSQPSSETESVTKALEARAELDLIRATHEKFKKEASLAKAEGLPDLTPHYRAESISREPRAGGFGVGINLPIFDHGSRRNRVRQAEASARAEEQKLVATQNLIRQEVTQALARLIAATEVVNDFKGGLLEESRKVLEASRKGFELGETSLVSLLEAQRTFRAVQTEYIDALASQAQARISLERATGSIPATLLPTLNPKDTSK